MLGLYDSKFENEFKDDKECIGKGAYGDVYKAKTKRHSRDCAVKIIRFRNVQKELKDFIHEPKYQSMLNHKHVVHYYSCWIEKNSLHIQMEFCEGLTLKKAIENNLFFDNDRVWRLFYEIVKGIYELHQQGIVHGDLRTDNIFLDSNDHAKIGDLGLAEEFLEDCDKVERYDFEEETPGLSLYYEKEDIFSLGYIFIEMCSAKPVDELQKKELREAKLKATIPAMMQQYVKKDLNQDMLKWILKDDPKERPTAGQLLQSDFFKHKYADPIKACLKKLIEEIHSKSELIENAITFCGIPKNVYCLM